MNDIQTMRHELIRAISNSMASQNQSWVDRVSGLTLDEIQEEILKVPGVVEAIHEIRQRFWQQAALIEQALARANPGISRMQ